MVSLVIYGVFDRRTGLCVKVGSTVKSLSVRARQYGQYKWFSSDRYEHRPLWQGEVADDELLHFIRATKEAAWIGRMRTWWDQGGLNKMNPVLHAIRNPDYFSELCAAGGRASKGRHKINDLSRAGRSASHEDKVRAGKAGRGECKARSGEKHPYFGKPGPRLGMHNSEESKEKLRNHPNNRISGILTNHRRWHEARGIVSESCGFCQGE